MKLIVKNEEGTAEVSIDINGVQAATKQELDSVGRSHGNTLRNLTTIVPSTIDSEIINNEIIVTIVDSSNKELPTAFELQYLFGGDHN